MHFYKYHGTGNDFILLDGMKESFDTLTTEQIADLCHRRFGIGADGLIILRPSESVDFRMEYYNSDGRLASMCGNGARCISQLYFDFNPDINSCKFEAVDGIHTSSRINGLVKLSMHTQSDLIQLNESDYEINTGSPHYIKISKSSSDLLDIDSIGKSIRYNDTYKEEGINVNIVVPIANDSIEMATYERGIEAETYSCGTGVVAAALVQSHRTQTVQPIKVKTKGGDLAVEYTKANDSFSKIYLIGPAQKVFEGEYYL
jgi:diaminopimelate epimerase